jgi:hypothetical protein
MKYYAIISDGGISNVRKTLLEEELASIAGTCQQSPVWIRSLFRTGDSTTWKLDSFAFKAFLDLKKIQLKYNLIHSRNGGKLPCELPGWYSFSCDSGPGTEFGCLWEALQKHSWRFRMA